MLRFQLIYWAKTRMVDIRLEHDFVWHFLLTAGHKLGFLTSVKSANWFAFAVYFEGSAYFLAKTEIPGI